MTNDGMWAERDATRRSLGVRLALPFAVFLAVAEVVRNWGDWQFWPFWVVDYIAVALLAWGWWAMRRGRPGALVVLSGAWGFTCAMFYMAFFSHLSLLSSPGRGPIDPRTLTVIVGLLFAVTVVGFVSTLNARRHAPDRVGAKLPPSSERAHAKERFRPDHS
jgi:hypothetical protein